MHFKNLFEDDYGNKRNVNKDLLMYFEDYIIYNIF